jgi:limonene-1,2-epoxide hydrolase
MMEVALQQGSSSSDALTHASLTAIEHFNEAFNRCDIDAVMALMSSECRFENTYPPPDGTVSQGQVAVQQAFEEVFASAASIHFETEEIFACGERVVVRWIYRWRNQQEQSGHIRGVDVFRVEHGKISEKLSYVKG